MRLVSHTSLISLLLHYEQFTLNIVGRYYVFAYTLSTVVETEIYVTPEAVYQKRTVAGEETWITVFGR